MKQSFLTRVFSARLLVAAVMLTLVSCLPGCKSGFFDPTGSGSGSSSGSGSATGNNVYIANANTALESVAAYSLSAGTLTSLANSPSLLGTEPTTMAINPAGTLLWVGSVLGAVYVYVINSDGSLSLGNSDTAVETVAATSMAVDPTGQWLLVLSDTGTGTAPEVYVYKIDSSNGTLTATGDPLALDTGSPSQIVFAPNGTEVFASLGTGGVDTMAFTPSTGVLAKYDVLLEPLGTSYADQGLAVDTTSSYLFVTETGTLGVRVLSIGSSGTLTSVAGSPFITGYGATSVLVDKTNSFVYVGNETSDSISAFTLAASTGVLTAVSGSPFTTGSSPYSLAEDSSGTYLLSANAGGTPDLEVFTITPSTGTTPGALTEASSISTGSVSPAGAISVVATP